jgi:hypothetical protein
MAPQRQIAESQLMARPIAEDRDASGRMPTGLRALLMGVLAAVLAGAAYLIAVRGEALLLDLAAFSQRIFCF